MCTNIKTIDCPECEGSGGEQMTEDSYLDCFECEGLGQMAPARINEDIAEITGSKPVGYRVRYRNSCHWDKGQRSYEEAEKWICPRGGEVERTWPNAWGDTNTAMRALQVWGREGSGRHWAIKPRGEGYSVSLNDPSRQRWLDRSGDELPHAICRALIAAARGQEADSPSDKKSCHEEDGLCIAPEMQTFFGCEECPSYRASTQETPNS